MANVRQAAALSAVLLLQNNRIQYIIPIDLAIFAIIQQSSYLALLTKPPSFTIFTAKKYPMNRYVEHIFLDYRMHNDSYIYKTNSHGLGKSISLMKSAAMQPPPP